MKTFIELREKPLTPAELKKREEVAKAIERENPNMPMGKKMAIATATAKKVAEEVEQIDESELIKAQRRHDKTKKELDDAEAFVNKSGVTGGKGSNYSSTGVMSAAQKSKHLEPYIERHHQAKKALLKLTKEETEQIDEISKKTLGSYVKKATGSAIGIGANITAQTMSSKGKADPDDKRQLRNRMTGVSRATDRLTKESVEELDENRFISKSNSSEDHDYHHWGWREEHEEMAQKHRAIGGRTHEAAAKQHDLAAKAHKTAQEHHEDNYGGGPASKEDKKRAMEASRTAASKSSTAYKTSQALGIKESVEELDEISRDTARSYIRKAHREYSDLRAKGDKTPDQDKKFKKREAGIELAGKKTYNGFGTPRVQATESVKSADKKLGKYVKPNGKIGYRMVSIDKNIIKDD